MSLSREEHEAIYARTIEIFAPHFDKKEATELAEQLRTDFEELLYRGSEEIIRYLSDTFYDLREDLQQQEIIRTLDALRDPLIVLLNQYAPRSETTSYAKKAILETKKEYKWGKSWAETSSDLAAQAIKQLNTSPVLKKPVHKIVFDMIVYELFKKKIEAKEIEYKELGKELLDTLNTRSLEAIKKERKYKTQEKATLFV